MIHGDNLPIKHPMFIELMGEHYYDYTLEHKIEQKMMNP
jgi:hypothetical protein